MRPNNNMINKKQTCNHLDRVINSSSQEQFGQKYYFTYAVAGGLFLALAVLVVVDVEAHGPALLLAFGDTLFRAHVLLIGGSVRSIGRGNLSKQSRMI